MRVLIRDSSMYEDLDILNFIIETSLLKLKEYSACIKRKDYERLLVIETLRKAIYNKYIILSFSGADANIPVGVGYQEDNRAEKFKLDHNDLISSMQKILDESISNLGLYRYLKLGFESQFDNDNEPPLLKFPHKKGSTKRVTQFCEQSLSGNIVPHSKKLLDLIYVDINSSTNRFLDEFLID